jgi:aldose sugar dehydrogenase
LTTVHISIHLLTIVFSLLLATTLFSLNFSAATGKSNEDYGVDKYFDNKDGSRATDQYLEKVPKVYTTKVNESILQLDNESSLRNSSSFSLWNDPRSSCITNFKCVANFSTGWDDNTSIQISTTKSDINTRSSISGNEVPVKPNERYELITHLMHNNWSTQSHVKLEGFNETSRHWYQIQECPPITNESLEWNEYKCVITIEQNVTKVRAVLNAGRSSQEGQEAVTWFDSLYMIKFKPTVIDPDLKAEVVYKGLVGPVAMQFLGPNDLLVIENNGTVQRIINGKQVSQPLLLLDVAENQGLLGIAIQKKVDRSQTGTTNNHTYVFLYYTANEKESDITQGKEGVSNRLYRYELIDNKLVNPKKLLELPAEYDHNGGPLSIGPDKNSIYVSIGDLENQSYRVIAHKALNNETGMEPDGSGGILRVSSDGEPVGGGLLGNTHPLDLYYAYGIRECFGMDFDPITGILWTTENGANWGDEINLVNEGFNGGWNKVQGIWKNVGDNIPRAGDITYNPSELVSFNGKGKYRSPEFTWNHTVAPTALKFLATDKLGDQYLNDMLVGDVNNGRIYHFKLNDKRNALLLNGSLTDKIANTDKELENVIFAKGFGVITDLKLGYDGYLYVVVFTEGKIYRISPIF